MIVRWVPAALQDRVDIFEHISGESPRAAVRMDQLFSDAAASLSESPLRGRAGSVAGTRELIPHESYRLVYEVEDDVVWILALVHTARLWPPIRP
jgi:addiction module RelE/StbE family toxin